MIDFSSIPKTKEKTYVFLSDTMTDDVAWCLRQSGVTDFKIHTDPDLYVPQHLSVPKEVLLVPVPEEESHGKKTSHVCVLVSKLEEAALNEKITEVARGMDSDLMKRHEAQQKASLEYFKQNEAPCLKENDGCKKKGE